VVKSSDLSELKLKIKMAIEGGIQPPSELNHAYAFEYPEKEL
jgi:hypothetical protein